MHFVPKHLVLCFIILLCLFNQSSHAVNVRPKSTRERKTSHTWYALPLLTDYSIQNYKHHVNNEDKKDESHISQSKFEYEIYLLNYTIKIKNQKTYIGLLRFF